MTDLQRYHWRLNEIYNCLLVSFLLLYDQIRKVESLSKIGGRLLLFAKGASMLEKIVL